ncbi:hypothetical protein RUND412_007109 [Rhizina undulata]
MPSEEAAQPSVPPYPYSSAEDVSPGPSGDADGSPALLAGEDPDSFAYLKPIIETGDEYNNPSKDCVGVKQCCCPVSRDPPGNGSNDKTEFYRSLFNTATSEQACGSAPSRSSDHNSDTIWLSPASFGSSFRPNAVFPFELPETIISRILYYLDHQSLLKCRLLNRSWNQIHGSHRPLKFPAFYRLPVELIQMILKFASPTDFNIARRLCKSWYISSLELSILHKPLKELGFYYTDPWIRSSTNPLYLSSRLSRECSLGAGGSGTCGLRNTAVIDLSELAATTTVHFTVSTCGYYALLSEGCVVYVYRLRATSESLMEFAASVICPRRVLAVSMDTSSGRFAIAILLDGRMGLVHDVIEQETKSTYRNLCSEEDSPRSVAICPQRRCVAFGCQGGIELHWVDALTGQDLNRWFPLTAPSDFLYFLPPRRGIDSAKKLRLISSAVHPEEINPLTKRFGINRGSLTLYGGWKPRIGQSDHFQAVPLSDGYHILFTDPESGGLCLGSDAPLGGPTKLLRKIWLIPPEFMAEGGQDSPLYSGKNTNSGRPSIYTSGSYLRNGIRVVAGYGDHVVLYTVPPDLFNSVIGESDAEGIYEYISDSATAEEHLFSPQEGDESPPRQPVFIHGCYVDTVPNLLDLAIDSGPAMTIYAFSASGLVRVYQLERTKASNRAEEGIIRKTVGRTGEFSKADAKEASAESGRYTGEFAQMLDGGVLETGDGNGKGKKKTEFEEDLRRILLGTGQARLECELVGDE